MIQPDDIFAWSDIADEFGDTLLIGNGGSIVFYYLGNYLSKSCFSLKPNPFLVSTQQESA